MKAVRLYGYGDVDQMRYEDVPEPAPGADEVLVKVAGTSVNPVDWKIREGHLKDRMPITFPAILGRDAAGEVTAVGAEVTNFKRGDKVLGLVSHGYAELVAAKASAFGRIPDGLDVEEAGVLPLILLTGTQLIEVGAQVTAGQTILITGALGSVGRTAVHVARKRGARVIAGVRAKQRDEAKELHADEVVALDDEKDLERMAELDAIAATAGGDIIVKLIPRLKRSGVLASVVGTPAEAEKAGIRIANVWAQADAGLLERLAADAHKGEFTIPIGKRFRLAETREAQQLAMKGGSGKILLVP